MRPGGGARGRGVRAGSLTAAVDAAFDRRDRADRGRSTTDHRHDCRGPVEAVDWAAVAAGLDAVGIAATGPLVTAAECRELADLYDDDGRFRSTVDMARHRYGAGQYRYFAHPLPDLVAGLRSALWPRLLPVARDWAARRDQPAPWPDALDEWLDRCHAAGQTRPDPAAAALRPRRLERPAPRPLRRSRLPAAGGRSGSTSRGWTTRGGEFVVVEQRPRAQSRATTCRCRRATAWCSRPATGPCAAGGAGAARRCATA